MLDRMTPQQFDEWVAFRRIEPDPDERLRVILRTGLAALCQAWGRDVTPEDLDPAMKQEATATDEMLTPEQAAEAARLMFGF